MKLRSPYLSVAVVLAAVMVAGCSTSENPAAPVSVTDTSPPPAPTGLAVDFASELNRSVLSWQASAAPDVAGYDVYQYLPDPSRDNAYMKINTAPVTDVQYALPGVGTDTPAFFRVRAADLAGNLSAYSATLGVVLQASAPGGNPRRGPGGGGSEDN